MTTSALDDIPGLGPARRKALLSRFGSVRALRAATPEMISEVPGIGPALAERIIRALSGETVSAVNLTTGEILDDGGAATGEIPATMVPRRGDPGRRRARDRGAQMTTSPPGDGIADFEVLLVSGMSGAGRSSAARALEDLGWFVIDNLPPKMLAPTLDLLAARSDLDRVAVVVDVRGGRLFDQLEAAVAEVIARGVDLKILFLESSDEALVRRFESNRRPHPLQAQGGLLDGIHRERALLGDLRGPTPTWWSTPRTARSTSCAEPSTAAFDSGRARRACAPR